VASLFDLRRKRCLISRHYSAVVFSRDSSRIFRRRTMALTRHGAAAASDGLFCAGPLASRIEGFAGQLSRQGYSASTVRTKRDRVVDLSRWLERRKLPLEALDEDRLSQFQASLRRRDTARRGDMSTGQQLLEYLRDRGDIALAALTIDRCPAACVVRDFEAFLSSERGLSRSTVVSYLPVVRCFLDERFGRKALHFEQLRPQDLHGFILREIQRVSRTHGKGVITALRSFLRFLLLRGAVQTDLARTLPGVASWRLSHLPRAGRTIARMLRSQLADRQARLRDPAAAGPARVARRRGCGHDVGGS
jgi:site-specific recombinase XerD